MMYRVRNWLSNLVARLRGWRCYTLPASDNAVWVMSDGGGVITCGDAMVNDDEREQ